MKRAADIAEKSTELYNINNMDNSKLWGDEKLMYDEFKDRIYIKHLYGPLFFDLHHIFKNSK
jgi:SulP family sulfate permease